MPKWLMRVAVVDGLLYMACAVIRSTDGSSSSIPMFLSLVYWLTVWSGLVIAIYGFFPLTRGGEKELRKSVTCIIFALVPACVGLITVLGQIGTPVG